MLHDDSVLTINAVAALLGISPDLLRRAERSGLIPRAARSPGGHRRYELADVDPIRRALEAAHRRRAAARSLEGSER